MKSTMIQSTFSYFIFSMKFGTIIEECFGIWIHSRLRIDTTMTFLPILTESKTNKCIDFVFIIVLQL